MSERDDEMRQGLPVLGFPDAAAFEAWLGKHQARSKGLWLKLAKRGCIESSLTADQAIDIALCQGWIDGQLAPYDQSFSLRRFTPRGLRSRWSKLNCDRAERLIAAKRMRPPGLAAIEAARSDGRWEDAYQPQSRAEVPEDLAAELAGNKEAAAFFEGLNRINRYAIIYRLGSAKKPETRRRRLEQFVAMLVRKEKIYP